MAKPKKDSTPEESVDSVKLLARAFFKNHKAHIYNDPDEPFKVSTGVYSIDEHLEGGIDSGTQVRLLGPPSSGKSSEGVLIIKNFLETRPKSRALIIPTEARLTKKIKGRSGVPFVEDPEHWENGTCLILPMNVYEGIANFLVNLVKTNAMRKKEDRENFIIFIDCMDYLMREADIPKELGEARIVAGSAYLTKQLWCLLALPFNSGQHIFMGTSQQSAAPKIDKYAKDPLRQGGSSGGTNIQYQASTVIDFLGRYEGDYILENPTLKYDPKTNDKIGHTVHGLIRKSDTERYDVKFDYKVKYGRSNGNCVWIESDIADWMQTYQLLYKESGKGSWLTVRESLRKELMEIDPEIPEKFQGIKVFMEYLENHEAVTKVLTKKMQSLMTVAPVATEIELE